MARRPTTLDVEVETLDLTSIGVIRDVSGHLLPMEAFTLANNMRLNSGMVERLGGRAPALQTPTVPPYFTTMIRGYSGQIYWVYFGLNKAYVIYAGVETEITRLSATYNAVDSGDINFTLLGGVPIFNTGLDVPQYWPLIDPGTKLLDLPAFGAANRAKVFRAFGPYLNAYNVQIGGNAFPNMVWWAHPADPGGTPISWDETDPTRDAGKKDLPDTESGNIVDARMLRGNMYIYKERSTWIQRFIGGLFVFSFDTFLETSGILAPRCVAATGDAKWHFVVTQDDIIIHDGNNVVALLPDRVKNHIFNSIDVASYRNSFCFTHPQKKEIWFCYPENGQAEPSRALIWNYGTGGGVGAFTEADIDFRAVGLGDLETSTTDTWDSESVLTWDGSGDYWDAVDRAQVLLCKPDASLFLQLDTNASTTNNGAPIIGTLQREGLAVIGRKSNGQQINEFDMRKLCKRVWIRASGGPIDVRIGYQEIVDGDITWSTSVSFDPTSQLFVDFLVSGIALAIEFSSSTPFSVSGYKLILVPGGKF